MVMSVAPIVLMLFLSSQIKPAPFELKIMGASDPELAKEVGAFVQSGIGTVEKFFGKPFPRRFTVEVFPSRSALDAAFKRKWNAPPTEKWMVAAGVSDALYLLSPKVWKTEAVEHDGDDRSEVRKIITHEITHVYHGQYNPKPDFDGMDEMAWFVEGLATYVRGQLENRGLTAKQAIRSGKDPKKLSEAWTGPYRYGVSGSIVHFVDSRYGRKKVIALLPTTSTRAALDVLGTDEKTLLRDWRASEGGESRRSN